LLDSLLQEMISNVKVISSITQHSFLFTALVNGHQIRSIHFQQKKQRNKYAEHFKTLELPESASKSSVRQKYIEMVKKYHPDTSNDGGWKFNQIDHAYKQLMQKFREDKIREEQSVGEYGLYYDQTKMTQEEDEEDDEHPDIRHTAPQHRQYLDNPFGYGSPAQREKQAVKYRAFKASEAVYEHRVGKLTAQYEDRLATRERNTIKKQHTRNEIERLVEDLIVESMANGEFDNLSGAGKPLPNRVDYNPYTDFTTHKINQILVETGFAPEWVQLQKDIREMKEKIRNDMMKFRQKLGPAPLTDEKRESWISFCDQLKSDEVKTINKMIEKFNLIVPNMNNQMFLYNVEPDAEKIYNTHIEPKQKKKKPSAQSKTNDDKFTSDNHGNKNTFLSSVFGLFNK